MTTLLQTIRLWLKPDAEWPQFRRLAYEKVDDSASDVLLHGVHPWMGGKIHPTLKEKFVQILNESNWKPSELEPLGYSSDVTQVEDVYYYVQSRSAFEETLERLGNQIRFVDALSYRELLRLAMANLRARWSHHVAYQLAFAVCLGFDNLRAFLKAKDKNLKLSGYGDIDRFNLGEVLSLEDFTNEERAIIAGAGLTGNFRLASVLSKVTDSQGRLRLTESIRDFQLRQPQNGYPKQDGLLYNGRCDGKSVRLIPKIDENPAIRRAAQETAEAWRVDQGRYCFTTSIERLERMLRDGFEIGFPTLNYMREAKAPTSTAKLQNARLERFGIGSYLTDGSPNERLKHALRIHGVSQTGRKEQLLDKLAHLAVKLYRQREGEMRRYFQSRRFIVASTDSGCSEKPFPVLEDSDQRNLILAMYAARHLRGDAILDASHENDAYDLLALAQALIERKIAVLGAFLPLA